MQLDRLNAWLTLAANFGVLAGIIFLGIEIRQNTSTLQAEFRQAALEGATEYLYAAVEDPELWLMRFKPNLTDTERTKLAAYLFVIRERAEWAWRQYNAGAIDEATWHRVRDVFAGSMSFPQTRKWWVYNYARGNFEPGFREEINALVEQSPVRTQNTEVLAFD